MNSLAYLAAAGGFATLGLSITVALFAIRNGGLKVDANRADMLRKAAEVNLKTTSAAFDLYRDRAEAKTSRLVAELDRYETQELDGIEKEPDRRVRIERRRSWVRGVLRQTADPESDLNTRGVRQDPAT